MAKKETDRFVKVLDESGIITCNEIWADTQTGVQYLYHASGNSGGLTVLVDSEGKPLCTASPPTPLSSDGERSGKWPFLRRSVPCAAGR